MIKVTLTINGETVEKQLPTNWDDVTWEQFVALSQIGFNKPVSMTKYLLGLGNIQLMEVHNLAALEAMEELLSFLQYPENMLLAVHGNKTNVAAESWEKLEEAKAVIRLGDNNLYKCGAELVRVYTTTKDKEGKPVWEHIENKPAPYALSLASFFLTSWMSFSSNMRNLTKAIVASLKSRLHGCRTRASTLWKNLAGWVRSTR